MFAWFAIITRDVFDKKTHEKYNNIPEVLCTVANLLIKKKKRQQPPSAIRIYSFSWTEKRFVPIFFSLEKSRLPWWTADGCKTKTNTAKYCWWFLFEFCCRCWQSTERRNKSQFRWFFSISVVDRAMKGKYVIQVVNI